MSKWLHQEALFYLFPEREGMTQRAFKTAWIYNFLEEQEHGLIMQKSEIKGKKTGELKS